jgi:two-component system, NtrC family, nitrogen regulation sensor histidine kinase NtrY
VEYSKLARLPAPRLQAVEFAPLVRRVASLENRIPITLLGGPEVTLQADEDQLEQCLINILKNAVEASLETQGTVRISWLQLGDSLEARIEDEGLGIANPANIFVPFFTTKPGGSGIGLAFSRQIAEAHEGSLSLQNRTDTRGCIATLRIPFKPAQP